MKAHVDFRYNAETKDVDFIVDGSVVDHFSSKDAPYLTSLSIDEIWAGRCKDLADKMFGTDNYLLDYFINGQGYKVNNPASEID